MGSWRLPCAAHRCPCTVPLILRPHRWQRREGTEARVVEDIAQGLDVRDSDPVVRGADQPWRWGSWSRVGEGRRGVSGPGSSALAGVPRFLVYLLKLIIVGFFFFFSWRPQGAGKSFQLKQDKALFQRLGRSGAGFSLGKGVFAKFGVAAQDGCLRGSCPSPPPSPFWLLPWCLSLSRPWCQNTEPFPPACVTSGRGAHSLFFI